MEAKVIQWTEGIHELLKWMRANYYTIHECADAVGTSRSTLDRYCMMNDISTARITKPAEIKTTAARIERSRVLTEMKKKAQEDTRPRSWINL